MIILVNSQVTRQTNVKRLRQRLGAARSGRQNSCRGMIQRLDKRDVGSGEQIHADTQTKGGQIITVKKKRNRRNATW